MRRTKFLAALFLIAAACSQGEKPASAAQEEAAQTSPGADWATAAAKVANAIEAAPDHADSILKAAGHTPESFQRLMYDIAADSAMSAAYAAARVK